MADKSSKPPEPQLDDSKGHQSYKVKAGTSKKAGKAKKVKDVKGHNSYPVEGKSMKGK